MRFTGGNCRAEAVGAEAVGTEAVVTTTAPSLAFRKRASAFALAKGWARVPRSRLLDPARRDDALVVESDVAGEVERSAWVFRHGFVQRVSAGGGGK